MSKNTDFAYPTLDDDDLLAKIFRKREFYYHKVPQRDILKDYDEIQDFRNANCKEGEAEPKEHQALLPNFISPNTPYRGAIVMYGTGAGKTYAAIRVAEQFKEQAIKYNTKIYVLVPGPNTKENFKNEIIDKTGETYLKNKSILDQLSKFEQERERKSAFFTASQYYKIMSYKSFYKKVLGEKISEKTLTADNKIKKTFRKTAEGEIEREIVVDKITNLNNTIIIIDEAHNIANNEYGDALKKMIANSENLRVLLLTATPMINLADEIVNMLNFLRPKDSQVERNKIFTNENNYQMKIKEGGVEYLQKMAQGYISFYRGAAPYTFATRVEKGVIPSGLLFTHVIKCPIEDFQWSAYSTTLKDSNKDEENTLGLGSTAAANFVFPGLSENKQELVGYFSTDGVNRVVENLVSDGPKLRALINKKIFKGKLPKNIEDNFIFEKNRNITGLILKLDYLKHFSTKFYKVINRLGKLVQDKKGAGTAFVYSQLVNAGGMELFAEAMRMNGYLEYQENYQNYDIKDETIDSTTGLTYGEFKKRKMNMDNFKVASFLLVTGGAEEGEELPEEKQRIIKQVFNNVNNASGQNIKFVLGSRVMNEGVTLKNVREVHIIDPLFNIPKMEQVIGRAIRWCAHKDVISDKNKFPKVNVYRYVAAINDRKVGALSTDEILYQKAELKYLTIKDVEHAIKQVAFDCPLLLHANVFPEDVQKYDKCFYPTLENVKAGKLICPALCDFRKCSLKCANNKLNDKYWDEKKKSYKLLNKNEIDYSTFNDDLASYEISLIKNRIKDLYRFKFVYKYNEIKDYIKKSFLEHQAQLFDDYFLDQALEDLMPKSENDFNSFKDTIYDKYNNTGYLIQKGKYYIFQSFSQPEDAPLYYRENKEIDITNQVAVDNYVEQKYKKFVEKKVEVKEETTESEKEEEGYNFNRTIEYYENRQENFIVGIIDKNTNKLASDDIDLFKIREPRGKQVGKKRGTGIPTLKGSVCATSKDKFYLMKLVKLMPNINKQEIERIDKLTRDKICNEIREKLLYLEKYSTSGQGNKMTYMMIPADHPIYEFPYNLEDRIKHIQKTLNILIGRTVDMVVKKSKEKEMPVYTLSIVNDKYFKDKENDMKKLKFKLEGKQWIRILS